MKKVLIILKKEFLGRVKKRSFILATLLLPILMPSFLGLIAYVSSKENQSEKPKHILVIDQSKELKFEETPRYIYEKIVGDFEDGKELFANSDYFAFLHIPQNGAEGNPGATLLSKTNLSINETSEIKLLIENQLREQRLKEQNTDSTLLSSLQPKVKLNERTLSDKGDEKLSNSIITFGIGYVLSMLIYMFVMIYGSQVMQSVIEEKSSKVVEIIVSIVRPVQLMMGKVFGIASVGLFQFIMWVILFILFSSLFMSYLPQIMQGNSGFEMGQIQGTEMHQATDITDWLQILTEIPYAKIIVLFLFYFLFGFLLYGGMFAAVGSAVETPQEAQQFVLPITIPLLISIVGAMGFVLQNPTGSVSFWLSIIPFTSPISMMTRIAFDVPWWQLLLSMSLLIITTFFMLWAAGRIFKVGILTQGAKINYKTLFKWFVKG